ncbi:MAG TPA: hypothetical protein VG754_12200 [Verrucomicrobiae bacterium]|nr:hypothetical protein [Verrucomicrobiae bacterium]
MAGCKTQVCDTRGQSEVCEIHHQFMQTEVVDNKKNWRMPSQEYLEARAHFFRHSYPFVLPEKCKKCAIYVCEDCVRAEEEWKRKHGQ